MFCDQAVKVVQGALTNLALTADLKLYFADREHGKTATESRRGLSKNLWTSIGKENRLHLCSLLLLNLTIDFVRVIVFV